MDSVDTTSTKSKGKECPPVPIKTYKWEDIKRSRLKGGYPWTYLQKGPYDEIIDPDIFKMDTTKKDNNSSTLGSRSESGVIIQELSDSDNKNESEDNISQYLDKDDENEPPESNRNVNEAAAGPSQQLRQERARSEEPPRKRKLSIESSYSRISMKSFSKLGIVKRLREAKDKIKLPKLPSFPKLESKRINTRTKEKPKEKIDKPQVHKQKLPQKDEKPVYIHIPLKLPPGETDEFSKYAEEEPIKMETQTNNKDEEKDEIEKEKDKNDIHLIILTAPSDDEVLDDDSIPETPSDKDKSLDKAGIDALKFLAKNVVDEFSPQTKKELNPIEERSSEEKEISNGNEDDVKEEDLKPKTEKDESNKEESIQTKQEEHDNSKQETNIKFEEEEDVKIQKEVNVKKKKDVKTKKKSDEKPKKEEESTLERMIVDEEDGLKLSEKTIALINEELAKENLPKLNETDLKSSLKSTQETPGSPTIKKKVSFKRKTKPENNDYEIIEVAKKDKDDGKIVTSQVAPNVNLTLQTSQSMSVDEEKTYLDDKIIKSTSLEEDYNKWSKNIDHEYEPVNPPPEEIKISEVAVRAVVPDESINMSTSTNGATSGDYKRRIKKSKNPNVIHIPLHDDVVVTSGEETENDVEENAQQMQDRLEAQYFAADQPINEAKTTSSKTSSTKQQQQPKDNISTMLTRVEGQGKKLKDAFNTQTRQFKKKIKGMKSPNISMPQRPKFDKAKIQRLKDSMPKMPDTSKLKLPKIPETAKINLPSFTLPKRKSTSATTSKWKQRQYSTESNVGDDSKIKKLFDFSTYPRLFKGHKQDQSFDSSGGSSNTTKTKETKSKVAATSSKTAKTNSPVYIRIPLHSEDSDPDQGASRNRYNRDIDADDDAYVKENQQIHQASPFSSKYIERWKHGTFHATKKPTPEPQSEPEQQPQLELRVTDLDNSDEQNQSVSSNEPRYIGSGSLGDIGRGVIEEINEDEFFVRQKGISQDNIEVGEYLTSEIREAFKNPINPLRQMQDESYDREYEIDISDQSIEEHPPRKRSIKKPKRKRTPHVSQEKIGYDQESITTEPEEYPKEYPPPGRPKRRSKKGSKKKEEVVPYQETIPVERKEDVDEAEDQLEEIQLYENEQMKGIEQPEIFVSNAYHQQGFYPVDKNFDDFIDDYNGFPQAPPRKHKSLKSLTPSEHDSIIGEYNRDRDITLEEIEAYRMEHEYIIPTPEPEPPIRPRRSRTPRTRSQSQIASNPEEQEAEQLEEIQVEGCVKDIDEQIKYLDDENEQFDERYNEVVEIIEEPCVRDVRDSMGYAVIDKSRSQPEPPLPPPRALFQPKTPPRKRRSHETKFFTVPRPLNDAPPVRPARNYSTLGSNKKKLSLQNLTDEEKENVDLQYSEIPEDEQGRDLQSGEVLQKMKDRPLPAPPRPPRKGRESRTLRDITNEDCLESIIANIEKDIVEEAEMSTQTEPLPDFECEEVIQEPQDKIMIPAKSSFDNEETITHGSLIIQPLDNAQILPENQLSRERIIPITRENFYENEISEVPEEFLNLSTPEPKEQTQVPKEKEVETLKAQKLQVSDLDVDRLTVNELLANKIRVSEIDSANIQVSEINSQSGSLVVNNIELPPSFIQELVDKLQSVSQTMQEQQKVSKEDDEQKKTPIELNLSAHVGKTFLVEDVDVVPERPLRTKDDDVRDGAADIPERPPRTKHDQNIQSQDKETFDEEDTHEADVHDNFTDEETAHKEDVPDEIIQEDTTFVQDIHEENDFEREIHLKFLQSAEPFQLPKQEEEESEIEEIPSLQHDIPPPRPPEPYLIEREDVIYLPSQPPPSFFTLRSPYDEFLEDIPLPPRRRRHQKQHVKDSTTDEETTPIHRRSSSKRSKTPEATIPELTIQLGRACASEAERQFKRFLTYVTNSVLDNADGRQDMHITIVLLLVLIAGLILLGFGDGTTTIHHHHWEFFNPPKNL